MTDPDLAERVRAAWGRGLYQDQVIDIAQAEADRARQEALDTVKSRLIYFAEEIRDLRPQQPEEETALQRIRREDLERRARDMGKWPFPQQPDKPTDGTPDGARLRVGMTDGEKQIAIPVPLSDAEILLRADRILLRECGPGYWTNREAIHARISQFQAQPAPDADVFEAFADECRSVGAAERIVQRYARVWFGPAIKALEEMESWCCYRASGDAPDERCGKCASCRAHEALTDLRERARRVTG